MVRVGIVGATGYTAYELIRIFLRHPQVTLARLTARTDAGKSVDSVHPALRKLLKLDLVDLDLSDFGESVDCAFCCLPHAASSPIVKSLVDRGIRTVDFSADYRLDDLASFTHWYQSEHADPGRVGRTPYGLPELFREQIRSAELVANPGCFPTSAILPLAPLIRESRIDAADIVVDSKTGVTGGGRTPKLAFHYPECNEAVSAYGVGTHRHWPEINQVLQRWTGSTVTAVFTPHLVPMDRGILSTIYVRPLRGETLETIFESLQTQYQSEPFIRVTKDLPSTKHVAGTNYCDIAARQLGDRIVLISVIDNLIKGASGAAVQNFNLMFGFPETMGLI
jgi:N-acetyl-gamma-glutamyl-phosphate reductase